MGKKYPSTLERALGGDDAARAKVIESTLGPVFDLSVHLCGRAEEAGALARSALVTLDAALRTGSLPGPSALAFAVAAVLGRAGEHAQGPEFFGDLPASGSRALLVKLACDPTVDELQSLFGVEGEDLVVNALRTLGGEPDEWSDRLDEHAAQFPLPEGITDGLITDSDDETEP
ncbi:MAG: hypothetical protein KDB53_08585 [Planctomycetes bacterium]|nr:hypothetical protein [Planctomycetota bacterium]